MGLSKDDRISTMISMIYINNILIVVFAQQFFGTGDRYISRLFQHPLLRGDTTTKKNFQGKIIFCHYVGYSSFVDEKGTIRLVF